MKFSYVENLLSVFNLQNPKLEVLEADSNPYEMLLYQHAGTLFVTEERFTNQDQAQAYEKLHRVIEFACSHRTSILITPEYSCPLKIIAEILSNNNFQPEFGKLWILGCESVSLAELQELEENFKNDRCIIMYDVSIKAKIGNFLDPVCFIFKTKHIDGNHKLICLFQFKTHHMGVWDSPIERNNYITGEQLYVFRNEPESIYLFTLICSEALNFDEHAFRNQVKHRWLDTAYIIINIQLNPKPNHINFRDFRRRILYRDRKEIITVNWKTDTEIKGALNARIGEYSRSAINNDSTEIDLNNDSEFVHNHNKGLYYSYRKPKYHYFNLNASVDLFLIQHTKPKQNGLPAQNRRTAPRVLKILQYENFLFHEIDQIDDGCNKFMESIHLHCEALAGTDLCSIEKERLVCISTGHLQVDQEKKWYRIDRVYTYNLTDDECISRITFTQDTEANNIRTSYLTKFEKLNSIIKDTTKIPKSIAALRGNIDKVLFYCNEGHKNHNYNLVSRDSSFKATGAFCGRIPQSYATKIYNLYLKLFNPDDQSRKLIVIWYEVSEGVIDSIYDKDPPSVLDDYSYSSESFKRS